VVAGITNDGSASLVAGTAVDLARSLGGRVRFVQVLPEGLDAEERADSEAVLFGTAMTALRGHPRVQATFESPVGDPSHLLVDRSRVAMALVVGRDQPGATVGHTVAAYCQTHCGCRVVVVPDVPSLTAEP
jgi:nucleotide-binding universal stress UspA family protein